MTGMPRTLIVLGVLLVKVFKEETAQTWKSSEKWQSFHSHAKHNKLR